jgi:methyltransferase-like protein
MPAARSLLDFLAGAIPDTPYGALVREEIAFIAQQPDAYVAHDHMADCNEPVYFHQFAADAARHRLQYLSEAEFSVMGLGGLPQQTIAAMRRIAPDIVAFEQLTDILRHRSFRQTLLVHAEAPIDRRLGAHAIMPFSIASPVTVAPPGTKNPTNTPVVFVARTGKTFGIGNAQTRAALLHLIERWPQSVPFDELYTEAQRSLPRTLGISGVQGGVGRETLGVELLQLYAAGIAELRTWEPDVSGTVAERPLASRLARLQAERGNELTTLLHRPLTLGAFERALVPLLDGNRDLASIVDVLDASGAQPPPSNGVHASRRDTLAAALRNALQRLAKAGALMKDRRSPQKSVVSTAAASAFLAFLSSLQLELV